MMASKSIRSLYYTRNDLSIERSKMVREKLVCPVCKEKNIKSCVYPKSTTCSKMYPLEYYDPDGFFHSHDRNVTGREYNCTNGHNWITKTSKACWCGWRQEPLSETTILKKNRDEFK